MENNYIVLYCTGIAQGQYCTWAGPGVEIGGVEDKRVRIWAEVTESLAMQQEWQGEWGRMTGGKKITVGEREGQMRRNREAKKNDHKGEVRHTDQLTYLPTQITNCSSQHSDKYWSASTTCCPECTHVKHWHPAIFPSDDQSYLPLWSSPFPYHLLLYLLA